MADISIIVPVYNVEKYIRRCIESLIAQTFESIEVLLIDDGSKDSSGAICDEYALKDARVKVIHKKMAALALHGMSGWIMRPEHILCFATQMIMSPQLGVKNYITL